MTTIDFSIPIKASKEKVWNMLWNDDTYREWTSVFMEGSYAQSDWEQGSEIQFLSPGGDGMYGIIQKKVPFEEMIFEHHGEIKKGEKLPKEWAGATEGYFLEEAAGGTNLLVRMDINDEYKDYFFNTFPKALELVRQISER